MLPPLSEAYRYISSVDEGVEAIETSNQQVLREIDYFRKLYNLKPEMIVLSQIDCCVARKSTGEILVL